MNEGLVRFSFSFPTNNVDQSFRTVAVQATSVSEAWRMLQRQVPGIDVAKAEMVGTSIPKMVCAA